MDAQLQTETLNLRSTYILLWALAVEHIAINSGPSCKVGEEARRVIAHVAECPYCWMEAHPEEQ